MNLTRRIALVATACIVGVAGCASMQQPGPAGMSFFVTSSNPGKGGDLGGLAGADQFCQSLAQAAGAGNRTWRAYLSTQGPALSSPDFVNARDRIGTGPWYNAKGVLIARNVAELHSDANNINKDTALNERGELAANDRSKSPNQHDILTGSRPDGTAFGGGAPGGAAFPDMTCGNWTKGGDEGSAMTGHFDRSGTTNAPWATSWNSSHPTLGCSTAKVRATGGDGRLYCFAAN
jgi:hypothetical protein